MSKSINQAGLAFIASQLNSRHKYFRKSPIGIDLDIERGMLRAWAKDAEKNLDEGCPPEIEIGAADAVSGHTELIRLDEATHFDGDIDRVASEYAEEFEPDSQLDL